MEVLSSASGGEGGSPKRLRSGVLKRTARQKDWKINEQTGSSFTGLHPGEARLQRFQRQGGSHCPSCRPGVAKSFLFCPLVRTAEGEVFLLRTSWDLHLAFSVAASDSFLKSRCDPAQAHLCRLALENQPAQPGRPAGYTDPQIPDTAPCGKRPVCSQDPRGQRRGKRERSFFSELVLLGMAGQRKSRLNSMFMKTVIKSY